MNENNDELIELQNDKFTPKLEKTKTIKKEFKKEIFIKNENIEEEDDNTVILGKEKRELINQIYKYKELFKEELIQFDVKNIKKLKTDKLKEYIIEIQTIIELGCCDDFITDSIYTVLQQIEPITKSYTKYDITGLTILLKSNKDFNKLMKQIMLKYNCYNQSSPEFQLLLIIISSVYLVNNKNKNKEKINNYLNEKIVEK